MKKILKRCLLGVAVLVGLVLAVGVVLAFLPTASKVDHPGITPDQAAKRRAEFERPHHTFEASDGETLFLRRWNPAGAPARDDLAVLIFHGVTAHSGAYAPAGEALSGGGYTTFGLDYRGHGLSGGLRGDYPSKERWIKDLSEAVLEVEKLGFPEVVVMGHSLGVASAIYAAKAVPEEIAGLMLLSAAYEGKEGVREPPSYFEVAKIVAKGILRPDERAIVYYRDGMTGIDDPLFNFRYTVRFFRMLDKEELYLPEEMNLPVLVATGDKDELFEVEKVRELYDVVPGDRKEFLIFEGAYHARIAPEHWNQLVDWLDRNYEAGEGGA